MNPELLVAREYHGATAAAVTFDHVAGVGDDVRIDIRAARDELASLIRRDRQAARGADRYSVTQNVRRAGGRRAARGCRCPA